MRSHRRSLRVLGWILITLFAASTPTGCTDSQDPWIGRVASVEGTVEVLRQAGERLTAQRGVQLAVGDRIETKGDSSASLQLADLATVIVGENSTFVVEAHEKDEETGIVALSTELLQGLGLIRVDPGSSADVRVRTPHVVTGVLGTEFGIEIEDGPEDLPDHAATVVAVVSGRVRVAGGGGSVEVRAGDGARGDGHNPPALMRNYIRTRSRLTEALQTFVREGADSELETIFRYY